MIVAALLGCVGFLACLLDWRRGLLLCLAVGFLQDPLRKLTPGQPVAFVVLVGVFFAGCAIGYLLKHGLGGINSFFVWYPGLKAPIAAFVALVVVSSGWTLLSTGNPVLAGMGLLSYLSPLVALFLGQRFCSSTIEISRWQKVYVAGAIVVGAGILATFVGYQSRLLESIGETVVFGRGGQINMVSGLLRSSETAAWHTATAACLVVIWSVARRKSRAFWLGAATTLALLLAVVLTGRRKTLGEALLFLIVFGFLLARARIGASRLLRVAGGLFFGGAFLILVLEGRGTGPSAWNPYFERSFSVVQDAGERLNQMVSVEQLGWIIEENGWLGRGAGTGSQGAQYFGGGASLVGWGAEGGLGKITAELGLPGILVAFWLTLAIGLRLWRLARSLPEIAPEHALRFSGLVALIPANAVVFLTAHQVFGDPFVLIVLGLIASSALAYPPIVARERLVAEERSHHAAPGRRLESAPA
ncbi:MAG: hypothetical protein AB7G12_15860 [Thermoanaerobaculia bacterium]